MEDIKILEWITNNPGDGSNFGFGDGSGFGDGNSAGSGSGSGFGYGSGSGWGSTYSGGSGDGFGYNDGNGYGCGNSNGSGLGYGYSDGIKSFNGESIYMIDGVQTIISNIKGNLAKGFILKSDLILSPCYICKGNGYFAHGETFKKAKQALRKKILENMNTDETIEHFLSTFEKEKKYPAENFYEWHHYLTGSCEMGRKSFMQDRNINFDDTYTVDEFITLCENSYGGEIIKELKERWNCRNGSD